MTIRLYAIPISNPSNAVRGMLAYKRLNYRLVKFQPGFHPVLVRAAGFPGLTVPAMEVDGRHIQSSIAISHFLEELQPDPPLYPADPEHRRAVEAAEQWGDAELQPVSRRIFRQALVEQPPMRRWLTAQTLGLMVDLQPMLEGRPCARAAALFPNYDGTPTPPNSLPADWLTSLR